MGDTLELTDQELKVVKSAFDYYDTDHNGHIACERLEDVMRNLGQRLTRADLIELIEDVDKDKSGTIEWEEFLPLYAVKMKEKTEQAFYKDLFRMLDKHRHGTIRVDELQHILRGMAKDVGLTEDEMDGMVDQIDTDGDGRVSFDEFYQLMAS